MEGVVRVEKGASFLANLLASLKDACERVGGVGVGMTRNGNLVRREEELVDLKYS